MCSSHRLLGYQEGSERPKSLGRSWGLEGRLDQKALHQLLNLPASLGIRIVASPPSSSQHFVWQMHLCFPIVSAEDPYGCWAGCVLCAHVSPGDNRQESGPAGCWYIHRLYRSQNYERSPQISPQKELTKTKQYAELSFVMGISRACEGA